MGYKSSQSENLGVSENLYIFCLSRENVPSTSLYVKKYFEMSCDSSLSNGNNLVPRTLAFLVIRDQTLDDPGRNQKQEPENPGPGLIVRSSSITVSEHA